MQLFKQNRPKYKNHTYLKQKPYIKQITTLI